MQAREEEIRFLKMQLAEEQRILSLMKRSLPSKKATEEEIVTLQIQVVHSSQVGVLDSCYTCHSTRLN